MWCTTNLENPAEFYLDMHNFSSDSPLLFSDVEYHKGLRQGKEWKWCNISWSDTPSFSQTLEGNESSLYCCRMVHSSPSWWQGVVDSNCGIRVFTESWEIIREPIDK